MIKTLLLSLSFLSLGGCLALTSSPKVPVTTYTLHAAAPLEKQSDDKGPSGILRIEEPILPAGLDTDRVALYLDGGRQLDYYAGAKWPGRLEKVLQDVMVEEARRDLPRMIIATPDLNLDAVYKLIVKVRDFAPVYEGGAQTMPILKAAATFTLIRLPENTVMLDFTLESAQPAQTNTLGAVTAGLETLYQAMLQEAYTTIAASLDKK